MVKNTWDYSCGQLTVWRVVDLPLITPQYMRLPRLEYVEYIKIIVTGRLMNECGIDMSGFSSHYGNDVGKTSS